MRLTDILQASCVKVPLEGDSKQACIHELVDLLAEHTDIKDVEGLKEAVWQRELTRTTGIGGRSGGGTAHVSGAMFAR